MVGAGRIAQVMHLHYLRELSDKYEISGLCDIAPATAAASAERFGVPQEVTSFESPFKRELVAFYDSVVQGTPPLTSGVDGMRDIALCQAIIRSFRTGRPVDDPTQSG